MTSFWAARPSGADAVFATNLSREAQAHAGSGPDGTGAAALDGAPTTWPGWIPEGAGLTQAGEAQRKAQTTLDSRATRILYAARPAR